MVYLAFTVLSYLLTVFQVCCMLAVHTTSKKDKYLILHLVVLRFTLPLPMSTGIGSDTPCNPMQGLEKTKQNNVQYVWILGMDMVILKRTGGLLITKVIYNFSPSGHIEKLTEMV